MITGGDEVGRTQNGNNNGFCQDNELSWFNWDLDDRQKRLRDFTRKLIRMRLDHPNLHRRKFFQDREIRKRGDGSLVKVIKDIAWFSADGSEVSDDEWNAGWTRAISLMLNGRTLQVMNEDGDWLIDDSFLMLVNAADQGVVFTLPESPSGNPWHQIIDTENIDEPFVDIVEVEDKLIVGGRALKVMSDRSVTGL
jgi:glycogen operon protein